MESLGGRAVSIDFSPFRAAASLLYSGPWVAERFAAVGSFIESHQQDVEPVVREIIMNSRRYTAVEAFQAEYRLRAIRRATESQWEQMDLLLLPTTGTIYTHEQVAADPFTLNTNLGYYTNFVNLLDLAAIAVPARFRANGVPFGVSLVGPAFSDAALLTLAARYQRNEVSRSHVLGESIPSVPGCIALAVAGAHLTGQPLNGQLTARGARLMKPCHTASGYRLYALKDSNPLKPALVRDDNFKGTGIEVEVWMVPENEFGRFVAEISPPLGIGSITLDTGDEVKGFICEPYSLAIGQEITSFGGWRSYLAESDMGGK
jgi:allophanate hydrolase